MSPTLVIAAREVRERRFILLTALVLGALPFAFPLLPSLSTQDARDARDVTAMLLSLAFPSAVALAVGASILGRDLGERRIGFYFARPIGGASLWAGKCLGAMVLVVLSVLLVAGPIASAKGLITEFVSGKIPFPLRLLAPGLFIFVAGGASVYRSRSPLLVLDIAFGATALVAVGVVMRTMMQAGAGDESAGALVLLVTALAAVLLLAVAFQIVIGRADVRRGQAALSTAVCAMGSVVLLGFFLWSRWVLAVTPQQVGGVGYGLAAAPESGVAVLFHGASVGRTGYSPFFVMNGSTGAYVRFSTERMSVPAFTRDGRVVWFARPAAGLPDSLPTLAVARFDGGRPTIHEIVLPETPDAARVLALDEAGGRAVLAGVSQVQLLDMTTGTSIATVSLPGTIAADFRPGGVVRLLRDVPRQPPSPFGGSGFAVSEWSPRSPSPAELWRVDVEGPCRTLVVRGDRAFATSNGRDGLLIDLEDGTRTPVETPWTEIAADVRPGWRTPMLAVPAQFLSDGQLAFGAKHELRLVGPKATRVVALEEGATVWTMAEPSPGELAVAIWGGSRGARRTVFLDTATGIERGEERGLTPAGQRYLFAEGGGRAPEAGSFAARLFIDEEGALIERRPDGSRRIVVAAPEP